MKGSIKSLKDTNTGGNIFPVTVADAVYYSPEESIKDKILEIEGLRGQHNSTYVIDLNKFKITPGSYGKPPYTSEQWAVAYNNICGFNDALIYASENGYNRVIAPLNTYSVCYTNPYTIADSTMRSISINVPSNITLDLNGSTIEVMYDSHNKNPYDNSSSSYEAWRLNGIVFKMTGVKNAHITNGKIIGDIINRSFDDNGTGFNTEKGMEQTYGVYINYGSSHCSVTHIDVSLFMGDGICLGSGPKNIDNWVVIPGNPTHSPGYIDDTGTVVAQAGSYVTAEYVIDPTVFKRIEMRSGGGYTRIVPFANRFFQYVFINSSGAVIRRVTSSYLQPVPVPYNAAKLRVQLLNETPGQSSVSLNYMVTGPQTSFIEISNCEIHDNHRGGLSGGSDYCMIRFCNMYHNGMDSNLGVPLFPDTTRYVMDFEDSYCYYAFIEKNVFSSGFNGLLLGVFHAVVKENIFNNVNGIYAYNCHNLIVKDNVFMNSSGIGAGTQTVAQDRNIIFSGNTVECTAMSMITSDTNTYVKMSDNVITVDSLDVEGNVDFVNNKVKSLSYDKYSSYVMWKIDCKTVIGNRFENLNIGTSSINGAAYQYRPSIAKAAGTDQMFRANVFKNVVFNSTVAYNDIEYNDSEFYDCTLMVQIKDKTKSSSLKMFDCYLYNTVITTIGAYVNDTTTQNLDVTVEMYNCRLKFDESLTKGTALFYPSENAANGSITLGRRYNLRIYKSSIENSITSKNINLISNQYANKAKQNLIIKDTMLNVTDITKMKFIEDISSSYAEVANCQYVGFDSIPSLTNALFIENDRYASEPTYGRFNIGKLVYNSNISSGGSLGWITSTPGYANNSTWQIYTDVIQGARINSGGYVYEASTYGRTNKTQPTFPTTIGSTVDDISGIQTWTSKTYSVGDLILPTTPNGCFYECTTAGTSGVTEPTWSTANATTTTTDGTTAVFTTRKIVTWKNIGSKAVFKTFGVIN